MNNAPWLEEPITTVARLGERLPHALLIQGPGGWGEERVANAVALELVGLPAEGEARGTAHPDLRWIAPVRPGDTLHTEAEVVEVKPSRSKADRGVVRLRYTALNQRGETVMTLIVPQIVARRPSG